LKFSIHRFDSLSSTNDLALGLDAPEGTVIMAAEQTAGKGRLGRKWSSPPGEGLYLTIVLRPPLPPDKMWQMAVVISLAACEAIREVAGLDAKIKWPNDILIGGRKVCGILIEGRQSAAGSQQSVVAGIGINVNNQGFPPELNATSLALELGRPIPIFEVEEALLSRLEFRYEQFLADDFENIHEIWKALERSAH